MMPRRHCESGRFGMPLQGAGRTVLCAGSLAALVLLAACGSTVQPTDRVALTGQGTLPDGLDPLSGQSSADTSESLTLGEGSAPDGARDVGATSGSQTSAGTSGGVATSPTAPGPSSAVQAPPPGTSGRGFTKSEISIGVFIWSEVGTFSNAIALEDADFGDQEAHARAIIKDLNRRGGLAGRQVNPVFYDIRSEDYVSNSDRAGQEACERWTKDQPVFAAVVVQTWPNETLFSCMAKNATPLIFNADIPILESTYSRHAPYLYSTLSPNQERFARAWLSRASDSGYFTSWDTTLGGPGAGEVRIGILTTADEQGSQYDKSVRRELARKGRPAHITFALRGWTNQGDMNAAILQFKQEQVTHVIPAAPLVLLLFPQSAENQGYRPRYLVASHQRPTLLEKTAPKRQLAGAMGVGFHIAGDVQHRQDPGDPSAAATRCREVMEKAGQKTTSRGAWSLMTRSCDAFNFLLTAVDRGGLSAAGLYRGAQDMGSMPPAATFRIAFENGRSDGPSAVRDLAYSEKCGCFTYLGSVNHGM